MSTYKDDIRQALKAEFEAGHLREVGDAADVFGLLAKIYPASGSKIDWKRVPGAVESSEENQSLQSTRFVEFFDEMRSRFELLALVRQRGSRYSKILRHTRKHLMQSTTRSSTMRCLITGFLRHDREHQAG